jgi:hypothetical protein
MHVEQQKEVGEMNLGLDPKYCLDLLNALRFHVTMQKGEGQAVLLFTRFPNSLGDCSKLFSGRSHRQEHTHYHLVRHIPQRDRINSF